MNKPISVIGLFTPKDGPVEHDVFIRGRNLTWENLAKAFKDCHLIITYNGLAHDIPKIRSEFPSLLPDDFPILDLYRIAKRLGYDTNLKSLEFNFGIKRLYDYTERRHIAVRLWKKYEEKKDEQALNMLIEYNKQDTVNLYLLAEQLMKMVRKADNSSQKPL